MTYQEFKDFLLRFLWRDGDAVLNVDLDALIRMGHAKLNQVLRVNDMEVTTTLSLTSEVLTCPAGFLEVRSVYTPNRNASPLTYSSPHELDFQRVRTNSQRFLPIYTHTGNELRFCGPMSVSSPETIVLTYYEQVPNFAVTDVSWLEQKYLDLYTYACLIHSAPYLRDDERLMVWQGLYAAALEDVLTATARRKYAGSPLQPPLPGMVR